MEAMLDELIGVWIHETEMGGVKISMTQSISDAGYETVMVYAMPDGARRVIAHVGDISATAETFRARFNAGRTEATGASDPAANFAMRPFTEAEAAETRAMLDQDIAYRVEGDRLITIVQGPQGPMEVVYIRQDG